MQVGEVLQPQYFEQFRCTGAECEDTCCSGWGIVVDRPTYDKYQAPGALNPKQVRLSELVEINPVSYSSGDFAKIRLHGVTCPALDEGICSIHQELGEASISDMCSSYPRVLNRTRGKLERSLHLSCPEAARLALTDPDGLLFEDRAEDGAGHRAGSVSSIDDAFGDPLHVAREMIVRIIRERSRPLGLRLEALVRAVEGFAGLATEEAAPVLLEQLQELRRGAFDHGRADRAESAAIQLETVLELTVARIGAEYTSPRFLECYDEFMRGLRWSGESTMEELAERYEEALHVFYRPFETRHPYLFENYLLNYVFRTLFPYGRKLPDQKMMLEADERAVRDALTLLVTHYAILRTMLIGMAALHGSGLSMGHALKLIQSGTRVFQHSGTVAAKMLEFVGAPGSGLAGNIAVLVAD